MSLPASRAERPAARAAADPPDEPPGARERSQGLFVVPYMTLKVCQSISQSGTLVVPNRTAPASRRRSTTTAFSSGTCDARLGSPHVMCRPATPKASLIVMGTP